MVLATIMTVEGKTTGKFTHPGLVCQLGRVSAHAFASGGLSNSGAILCRRLRCSHGKLGPAVAFATIHGMKWPVCSEFLGGYRDHSDSRGNDDWQVHIAKLAHYRSAVRRWLGQGDWQIRSPSRAQDHGDLQRHGAAHVSLGIELGGISKSVRSAFQLDRDGYEPLGQKS